MENDISASSSSTSHKVSSAATIAPTGAIAVTKKRSSKESLLVVASVCQPQAPTSSTVHSGDSAVKGGTSSAGGGGRSSHGSIKSTRSVTSTRSNTSEGEFGVDVGGGGCDGSRSGGCAVRTSSQQKPTVRIKSSDGDSKKDKGRKTNGSGAGGGDSETSTVDGGGGMYAAGTSATLPSSGAVGGAGSNRVPHKIIANWRQACDRTRDRTRDLLKRWRTLPEFEGIEGAPSGGEPRLRGGVKVRGRAVTSGASVTGAGGCIAGAAGETGSRTPDRTDECGQARTDCGWSVHVWTTWVDRFSVDMMDSYADGYIFDLTPTQISKFSHFYTFLLDHNRDDLISYEDFETFIERLRHFADWSTNSTEYNILREVERGFMNTFLQDVPDEEKLGFQVKDVQYLTKDGWLLKWARLITGSRNLIDFPIWLQYFNKVLFLVINKSGSGVISQDELRGFYSSVLGLDSTVVDELVVDAYQAMTSKGDHPLNFSVYRLCFANYLLGRHPNGPGLYLLGGVGGVGGIVGGDCRRPSARHVTPLITPFPVDYSALNATPDELERYTGSVSDPLNGASCAAAASTANYPSAPQPVVPVGADPSRALYTAARHHCRRSVIV